MTDNHGNKLGEQIHHEFFCRCVDQVAQHLIGCYLFVEDEDGRVGGEIIETESYCQNDPAAHCYKDPRFKGKILLFEHGKRRDSISSRMHDSMYKSGGHIYVFDRKHFHLNFVCGDENFGSGVLIRALRPTCGKNTMFSRRPNPISKTVGDETYLCNGPMNLCEALGINHKDYDGKKLSETPMTLFKPVVPASVVSGPRILGEVDPEKPRPWHASVSWPRSYILADGSVARFLSPGARKIRDRKSTAPDQMSTLRLCTPLADCKC